jgi:16S rRNA (uracil1498-N3)-methyltransferase
MKIHRFVYNFHFNEGLLMIKDRELINQIKNVLRLRKSERLILIDLNKKEALCEVMNVCSSFVQLKLIDLVENINISNNRVNLYCSILKKDNFELVAEKAVEVGVLNITPVIFQRTVKTNLNFERLNRIIKEAIEQSERCEKVVLNDICDFKKGLLSKKWEKDLNILCDRSGKDMIDIVKKIKKDKVKNVNIFIGPEGGFLTDELFLAEQNGFLIMNLGSGILRAETAAIVSSFVLNNF